ncbi:MULTISPECIES: hypothetical protein [Asaia]|uniref:PsiF repeat-containing protein n=2 Tax=Asaia TaxID=91914 RepID=A0ABQ1LQP4_9PROT|nr:MULTISPECIES: hypothetical protein [Asaia]GBR04304.1 hypothetical protein AA0323_0660 [Asaia siamensis NRIC 0323]GBR22630.1 hypothetical protein AA105894_3104 [Asaia spathodeae NBRC 105894]GGC28239.1 hypothetical protein GCM10007207_12090 [Asaia siamensis]
MLRGFLALTLLCGAIAAPVAYAKPCRDATTGKFTKCEKPKAEKCRDAKGKFTKCKADTAAKDDTKAAPAATPADGAPGKN